MKKQIYLLLIAVALNLSNGVQASAYLPRATRQATSLISRYATRPGGLSQGVLQYAKQPMQQQFAQPGLSLPAMRTFATKAPVIVARPQYSYWQQLKDSPTARWIAGLLAGGTLIGTGSALAQESESKPQEGIFERWFGKPRGYSAGKLQEDLSNALADALASNSTDRVRDLIAKGVDVNATNRFDKKTPLMFAIDNDTDNDDPDTVRELINAGADVNAKDIYGNTPLMLAVNNDNTDIVKELIQAGANVNSVKMHGINDDTPLMLAIGRYRNTDIIKELIQAGADVNTVGKHGYTPLMLAIGKYRNTDIIKELIQAGADVNAIDNSGDTVLIIAIIIGDPDAIRELINAGADVNAKDKIYEKTALELAQKFSSSSQKRKSKETIELLKSSGAKEHSDSWTEWKEWTCKKLGIS